MSTEGKVINCFKRQKIFPLLRSENAIGRLFFSCFQFQTFQKQKPVDPMGWNQEFWRTMVWGRLSRHHQDHFDNFECSRSTWLWWMRGKKRLLPGHTRPPSKRTRLATTNPLLVVPQINGKYLQVNNLENQIYLCLTPPPSLVLLRSGSDCFSCFVTRFQLGSLDRER